MSKPIVDKFVDSIREVVINIIGGVAANQFCNSLAPSPSPVVVVQPSPNSMFNIPSITSNVIAQVVFYSIRRPNGLISVINEGTGAIAYGIRRILHLQRRPNTVPAPVEFHPVDINVYPLETEVHPVDTSTVETLGEGDLSSQLSRFVEAFREFMEDAPLTSNAVRDSFIVGSIFIGIVLCAQYFATQHNRNNLLERLQYNDIDPQSGSPSSSGSSVSIDREGRIIVVVPLALVMGSSLAIIAIFWIIWRSRVSKTGNG
jgi:hypothetical protein